MATKSSKLALHIPKQLVWHAQTQVPSTCLSVHGPRKLMEETKSVNKPSNFYSIALITGSKASVFSNTRHQFKCQKRMIDHHIFI